MSWACNLPIMFIVMVKEMRNWAEFLNWKLIDLANGQVFLFFGV